MNTEVICLSFPPPVLNMLKGQRRTTVLELAQHGGSFFAVYRSNILVWERLRWPMKRGKLWAIYSLAVAVQSEMI